MTIREQIQDAQVLVKSGRHQGALTTLLLAVAASSRRVFPIGTKSRTNPGKNMSDGEAFTLFLGGRIRKILFGDFGGPDEGHSGVQVDFRGKGHDIAYILYKFYRCELVHDGELPADVEFAASESQEREGAGIQVSISNANKMVLDHAWLKLLVAAVVGARCNGLEFGLKHYDLETSNGLGDREFCEQVANVHHVALGRVRTLRHLLRHVYPPLVVCETEDALVRIFGELCASGVVHPGQVTLFRHEGFLDGRGGLSKKALAIWREIAAGYTVVEVS